MEVFGDIPDCCLFAQYTSGSTVQQTPVFPTLPAPSSTLELGIQTLQASLQEDSLHDASDNIHSIAKLEKNSLGLRTVNAVGELSTAWVSNCSWMVEFDFTAYNIVGSAVRGKLLCCTWEVFI